MFRIFKVIKEINLYREYLGVIKKESLDSPEWGRLRLRKDWFGRIYTVINLPPEVTKSPDFPKYARPSFVFEQIRPINEYLTKLSLQELISPLLNPVEGTDEESYLVVYNFIFRQISLLWILRFCLEIAGIFLIISKWDSIYSLLHSLLPSIF
jgi:hypothetical protein